MTQNEVLLAVRADVILINGLGLDEWVNQLLRGKSNEYVKEHIVEIAEAIPEKQLKPMVEGHVDDGHGHKHGEHDPHVWLGPPQVKAMVEAIAAKLSALDPAHKKNYEGRAQSYVKEVEKLHEYGKAAFKNKKSRNIISTHDSLQYFADAFGLKVVGTIQPRAGIEADAQKLTGLVKVCKDNGVSVLAKEPQYDTKQAKALQSQLAKLGMTVELVDVDPLETAPAADNSADPDPAYYIQRMRANIDNLDKALP